MYFKEDSKQNNDTKWYTHNKVDKLKLQTKVHYICRISHVSRSFLVRVFHQMQGTAVHHAVVPVVIAANVVNGSGVGEGISGRAGSGVTHIAQLERNLIACPQFRQVQDGR